MKAKVLLHAFRCHAVDSIANGIFAALENAESGAARRGGFLRSKRLWRDRLQFIRDTMHTFRVAEEQISVRSQVFSQTVDNFNFFFPLKIDQSGAGTPAGRPLSAAQPYSGTIFGKRSF